MNCPACRMGTLVSVDLEKGLAASRCKQCGGHWITESAYRSWLEGLPEPLPEKALAAVAPVSGEGTVGKLCPTCRTILRGYPVGKGLEFTLDNCVSCGGVWLDANEWEILAGRNLHDDLNDVFTRAYQIALRREEKHRTREAHYREKFGDDVYAEIKRVRAWIRGHEASDALIGYLTDPDPYEA